MTVEASRPQVYFLHEDSKSGEATVLSFYSKAEAQEWLLRRLSDLGCTSDALRASVKTGTTVVKPLPE